MTKVIVPIFFALTVLAVLNAPAISQTSADESSKWVKIEGERREPTSQECLAALESGRLLPFSGTDRRWLAEAYAIYRGSVFLLQVQGGTLSCTAWRY